MIIHPSRAGAGGESLAGGVALEKQREHVRRVEHEGGEQPCRKLRRETGEEG
ncbi:MAG: hypothetical protein H7067_17000 [Burkholderiales bacterium]|nr:hypothetical protein [Opitutaceae bacterium]